MTTGDHHFRVVLYFSSKKKKFYRLHLPISGILSLQFLSLSLTSIFHFSAPFVLLVDRPLSFLLSSPRFLYISLSVFLSAISLSCDFLFLPISSSRFRPVFSLNLFLKTTFFFSLPQFFFLSHTISLALSRLLSSLPLPICSSSLPLKIAFVQLFLSLNFTLYLSLTSSCIWIRIFCTHSLFRTLPLSFSCLYLPCNIPFSCFPHLHISLPFRVLFSPLSLSISSDSSLTCSSLYSIPNRR